MRRPKPLVWRRPALIWTPLGFLISPALAAAPWLLWMWWVESGSPASPAPTPAETADALQIAAGLVALGLACAFTLGLAWALLSRNWIRRRRPQIALEATLIGAAFAIIINTLNFGYELLNINQVTVVYDRSGVVMSYWEGLRVAIMVSVAVSLCVAPLAGWFFSFIAFRRATPQTAPPPATP